jgi:hypothetical protein
VHRTRLRDAPYRRLPRGQRQIRALLTRTICFGYRRGMSGRELLLFAITPPRSTTPPERVDEISAATIERLATIEPDALVVYDIDDESDRTAEPRPFPFLPTLDPADYVETHFSTWTAPVVIYRAVAKYDPDDLRRWLQVQDTARTHTVLVGASNRHKSVPTTLRHAYEMRASVAPDLRVGGVMIPERHARTGVEHLRLLDKQSAGCSFFVSQIVFDTASAKNLVSDYHYECGARGVEPAPLVFTLSVCGSMKTLEFMKWLGVDVPRWVENDLQHAGDTLAASVDQSLASARELIAFCRRLSMPFGISIESVSIRRDEIDAAVTLAQRIKAELRNA